MIILIGLLGLIIGSFLNVIIFRVPQERSIVFPASHCPHCKNTLKWYMNIPVISFIFLKGKCAYCKQKISIQYPIIEFMTFAIFIVFFILNGLSVEFATNIIFVITVVIISLIDIRHFIIPWEILIPSFLWKLITSMTDHTIINRLIAFVIPGIVILVILLIGKMIYKKDAMGGGDVYYSAFLGLYIGLHMVPMFLVIAFISGAIIGGAITYIKKNNIRETIIPFGPFLSLGAIVCYFGGEVILDWYKITFMGGL